jgi:DNA-binding HxlR family transcriptional regulator
MIVFLFGLLVSILLFQRTSMLHSIFTDILRFRIALSLAKSSSDFNNLKTDFLATDGNLSFHLKKLESEWIIFIEKSFQWKKPHTRLAMTDDGRKKLIEHLDELEKIIRNT